MNHGAFNPEQRDGVALSDYRRVLNFYLRKALGAPGRLVSAPPAYPSEVEKLERVVRAALQAAEVDTAKLSFSSYSFTSSLIIREDSGGGGAEPVRPGQDGILISAVFPVFVFYGSNPSSEEGPLAGSDVDGELLNTVADILRRFGFFLAPAQVLREITPFRVVEDDSRVTYFEALFDFPDF